jgi:hypothetical protein
MTRFAVAALALFTITATLPAFAVTPGELMHSQWIGR